MNNHSKFSLALRKITEESWLCQGWGNNGGKRERKEAFYKKNNLKENFLFCGWKHIQYRLTLGSFCSGITSNGAQETLCGAREPTSPASSACKSNILSVLSLSLPNIFNKGN